MNVIGDFVNTVQVNRTSNRDTCLSLLVIGLFVATVAVPRVLGSGGAVRLKLFVESFLFVLILSGIGVLILSRRRFRLYRNSDKIVLLLTIFVFLSLVSLITGFAKGYPSSYVLGDFYKFTIPTLAIFSIYAGSSSSRSIEHAFAVVHRLYLPLILGLLLLYITGVLQQNQRPGFIYQLPIMLVISYWLYREGDVSAKIGFPFLLASTIPIIYFSQSLYLILQILLTTSFAVLFYHIEDGAKALKGTVLLGIGSFFAFIGFWLAATQVPVEQWHQYGYLGRKVGALVGDYTLFERLILLGGSRAAEPFGILGTIDGSFFEVLFGAGMGSSFIVTSPFPGVTWTGADHFVHSGFWEAVLRTGLLGGMAYLMIVIAYLYVGWQVSSDSYLGAAVAANAVGILLFLPLTGSILGTQFFPFALFAYGLVRWGELND